MTIMARARNITVFVAQPDPQSGIKSPVFPPVDVIKIPNVCLPRAFQFSESVLPLFLSARQIENLLHKIGNKTLGRL